MWLVYEQVDSAGDPSDEYLVSTEEQAIYLASSLNAIDQEIQYDTKELKPLTPEEIERWIQQTRKVYK